MIARASKKIMVAMSGGVDSSVAAYILKCEGHAVVGVTMWLGMYDPLKSQDFDSGNSPPIHNAKIVCDLLGIPHHVVDFSAYLNEYVIANFIDEYVSGRTPNPCVRCNRYLKFHKLLQHAKSLGCEAIATGHYARIGNRDGKVILMRNHDTIKDQSYFLYHIPSATLTSVVFPLSDLKKKDVWKIADEAGINVAKRDESQEICFINDNNYRTFLKRNGIIDKPGYFVDTNGKKIGTHSGIFNYTVGQRKGLGIAAGYPLFVIGVNPVDNTVLLGKREELYATGLDAYDVNMFTESLPSKVTAKVRYGQMDLPCTASVNDGILKVDFNEPVDAVTPGQSVVVYHNDEVVGGGVIQNVFR